ncbi:transmembrane protein 272-like [Diadema antillarum]|uniref:transmembrane protein 272-like n=1 Tax=Diadema antillarum TaxID=105358 RepID=UPI003A8A39D2
MSDPEKAADSTEGILPSEAPPSYDAAGTESAPPPSYQSLYGQLKDCKEKNSNPVSFMSAMCKLLLNTLCVTILMALVLAIPIAMIVIGAMYKNDCPVQYLIPIYLIVMGAVYSCKSLMDLKVRFQRSRLPPEEQEGFQPSTGESAVSNIVGLFLFAFFIAGNVWIYGIYAPNTSNPNGPDYCDPTLYYFSFWVTTAAYIAMALGCCCCCGAACVACMFSGK